MLQLQWGIILPTDTMRPTNIAVTHTFKNNIKNPSRYEWLVCPFAGIHRVTYGI